ncbi:MAG: RIP metalloprotease RseP, partial [Butyricicoccaceae bacterium]
AADAPHRALILAAGPLMNFIAGLLIVLVCFAPVQTVAENTLESTEPGFAGAEQLHAGDTILSIDGYRILLNTDISVALSRGSDDRYDIKVRRDGETLLLEDVPMPLTHFEGDPEGQMRYGLNFRTHDATILDKIQYSAFTAFNYARLVWISLGDLISGAVGVDQLSGPVGVTDVLAETAQSSMRSFMMLLAFISVNLGVMNLLPLPALDGGRLLFIVIELILRRPVNKKYEGLVHAGGLALLMMLMLYVTFQDISRLIG